MTIQAMTNNPIEYLNKTSLFNQQVTANRPVEDKDATVYHLNLARWLQLTIHPPSERDWLTTVKAIQSAAAEGNKERKTYLKGHLPSITPAACHAEGQERQASTLQQFTGLMMVDVDRDGNPDWPDAEAIKQALATNPVVAFAAYSTSGQGVWGLVPVAYPETKFRRQYDQLRQDFLDYAGLSLDTKNGPSPQHLRFYSYDPDPYINPDAKTYKRYTPKPKAKPLRSDKLDTNDIHRAAQLIEAKGVDITETYDAWFGVGCAIANELGEEGRDIYHTVSQFHPEYDPDHTDRQFEYCLKWPTKATKATLFHHMALAGLYLKEHHSDSHSQTQAHTDTRQAAPDYSTYKQTDSGHLQPTTDADKQAEFQRMASANPDLLKLKDRLGLDIHNAEKSSL